MRSEIPHWIILACGLWGRQKRRCWIGTDWHGNVDGYAQSLLGRIRDEREGAGQGETKQHWPEVFWGMGLEVQRAITGMRETPHSVGHLHYVWLPEWQLTVEEKAASIGISKAEYWRELENFETWVHAKLDSVSPCPSMKRPLQMLLKRTKVTFKSASLPKVSPPKINLEALRRKKLSLVS